MTRYRILHPNVNSPQRLTLETSNFVHGSAMRSLSLVMSECSLSGRGRGHVSSAGIMPIEARGNYLPEAPYLRETKTYLNCNRKPPF